MALPARPVWSCATSTSALGERRKRCRLRRDSRSVAKTRCSSAASASRSPRSAARMQTAESGAWARVEDIVTSKGGPLIPASIAGWPRRPPGRDLVRRALTPFAAGRDQRKNAGDGKAGAAPQPRPDRVPPSPTAATKGPLPAPKKPVAIGRAPPSTPASVKAARPDFIRAGLLWCDGKRDGWRAARGAGGAAAGGARPAGTAHWPTAGIGLELTAAEAAAP